MNMIQPLAYPIKPVSELGCPEGYPTDLQGWHSDHDTFRELIEEAAPSVIIEVGSWKGASALNMAQLTEDRLDINDGARIYCVDTWLGGYEMLLHEDKPPHNLFRRYGYPHIYEQFIANVHPTGYAKRIYPIAQTSVNGARMLRSCEVTADLIYIDGSHQMEDVYEDLRNYWALLRPGGIMFGDDWELTGVEISVKRFCLEMNLPCQIASEIFWILRKPE